MKSNKNTNLCKLYVDGMHCAACELLIENKAKNIKGVKFIDARLDKGIVEVVLDEGLSSEQFASQINKLVGKDGYTIHTSQNTEKKQINWYEFLFALPITLFIILLFIALERFKILSIFSPNSADLNYPALFILGIIASLSSCSAVVGGLALSISANYAKEEKSKSLISHLSFHVSRLISFFILGGVIGIIGSLITVSIGLKSGLTIFIGIVMIILGLNLLNIFDFTKRLHFRMPKLLSKKALNMEKSSSKFTPILLGALTFFIPCGFTQAAQISVLGSGSFLNGGIAMLIFALGTLPVLGFISFASVNLASNLRFSGIFFKAAGLIVLFFAFYSILGALTVLGWIPPILNF